MVDLVKVENGSGALEKAKGLDGLQEDFLRAQDVKPSSRETYRRSLKPFIDWLTASGEVRPNRETILSYKRSLQDRGLSPLSIATYLVTVRKFFQYLEAEGLYPNIAQVKAGGHARGFRKDALTVAQVKDLLVHLREWGGTEEGLRNYALVNLLVRTGLRTVEAVRANVGDIRTQGGEAVLWIQGKGREMKDEFVLLTPETLTPLMEYISTRGNVSEQAPLFASHSDRNHGDRVTTRTASRIVKEALKGAHLNSPRLTAHSTRHTAVTLALMGGASVQEAQAMARHASINTTMIYAHNLDRIGRAPERKIDALLA